MAFRFNFDMEQESKELYQKDTSLSSIPLSSDTGQEAENTLFSSTGGATHQDNCKSSSCLPICKRHQVRLNSNVISASDNAICLELQEYGKSSSFPLTLWYQNGKFVDMLSKCNAASKRMRKLAGLIEHSDIRSGVYEGGFKIWECSIDLIHFLKLNFIDTKGKDVLELGCGGGLPGIYCFVNGANSVCFQDFNEEVIEYFTIPNLYVNIEKHSDSRHESNGAIDLIDKKAVFLSGDWKEIETYLDKENRKFDLLLSSETIYNSKNYPIFHKLICSCLKKTGYALLANKSYYFGVGGSSKEFVEYVEMVGKMQCKIVHEITEGVNRDILKLWWK